MFFAKYNVGRYFSDTNIIWFDIGMHIAILVQQFKSLQNLNSKVKGKKLSLVLGHIVVLKEIIDGLSSVLHLNFSQFISHFYG